MVGNPRGNKETRELEVIHFPIGANYPQKNTTGRPGNCAQRQDLAPRVATVASWFLTAPVFCRDTC